MSQNLIAEGVVSIGFDGSQVEAGVAKTVKSISTLGQYGTKAGAEGAKGIKQMADGAQDAAVKIDASTKRMARSIESSIAAAKAGSRGTAAFYESIANIRGANLQVLRPYIDQLKQVEQQSKSAAEANKKLHGTIGQSSSGFGALTGTLKGTIAAYASFSTVTGIAKMSDQYKLLNAQLKNSTGSQLEFNQAFTNVQAIAERAQIDVSQLSKVYARLSGALKEFGTSQQDIASLTETLSLALKVNGATTEETTSALLQLSQAFGKGKLDGDEFKSVMEAAPNVMRELAKSMNVPFGSLKDLAAQGQITSEVLLKAFTNQGLLGSLRAQASQMQTVSGAMQGLKNELLLFTGTMSGKSGIVDIFSNSINAAGTAVKELNQFLREGRVSLDAYLPAYAEFRKKMDEERNPVPKSASKTILSRNSRIDSAIPTSIIPSGAKITDQLPIFDEKKASEFKRINELYERLGGSAAKGGYGVELLSVQLAKQNQLQKDAKALLDANKLSQLDYNAIVQQSNASIKSLTGETAKRNKVVKEETDATKAAQAAAQEYAKTYADLFKEAEALTRPQETQVDQLQRLLDGFTGADAAARKYIQTQIDLANDTDLEKSLQNETNARLDQIEAIKQQAIELEQENTNYGKLPSAIADVTIMRLQDTKAMQEGLGLVVPEIDAQISAYQRLKEAMVGKEFLEAEEKRVEASKKAAEEIRKQYEETSRDIGNSITDALMRGFESGKDFAKNFRDTLINMFKSLILKPIVSFLVDSSGITKILGGLAGAFSGNSSAGDAASAITGQGGFGGLLSQGRTLFDGITKGFSSLDNLLYEGIAGVGTALRGFGLENLGTLIENNSTMLGNLSPYLGAGLALLKGDIKGAAFQGAGAAIGSALGGPVGGAIGAFLGGALGGLFGKKKAPRFSTQVLGQYKDGEFSSQLGPRYYKPLGADKPLADLSEQFSRNLGVFLKGFGFDDTINTKADLLRKRKKSYGMFSATFDGGSVSAGTSGKAKAVQQTFDNLVATVLGTTLVQAIQQTRVADGIKMLFNGLTDKTQVSNMINASLNLNSAQAQLADRFGLTVDAAGKVTKASGQVGDALIAMVNKLANTANAFKTPGDILVETMNNLQAGLNENYGSVVTDAIWTQVSRQVEITQPKLQNSSYPWFTGGNAFNGGLGYAGMGGIASNTSFGMGSFAFTQQKQYKTVYENILSYVDRVIPSNIALPNTLKGFDDLLKSIDKTTLAGQEMFANLFGMRDQFSVFTKAIDDLKGGVRSSLFGIVSDSEQQSMLNSDLFKVFNDIGRDVPASVQELVLLGKSIDYTTKEGIDLAAVFPGLVSAFVQTRDAVDSLMNSLRDVNQFKTIVDFNRYKGLASNYGNSFANSYTDGLLSVGSSSNFTSNTPINTVNIQPSNNTTISTSDPNLLQAIYTLNAKVDALQLAADKSAIHSKRAADVLVNVSPDGNILQTKATV